MNSKEPCEGRYKQPQLAICEFVMWCWVNATSDRQCPLQFLSCCNNGQSVASVFLMNQSLVLGSTCPKVQHFCFCRTCTNIRPVDLHAKNQKKWKTKSRPSTVVFHGGVYQNLFLGALFSFLASFQQTRFLSLKFLCQINRSKNLSHVTVWPLVSNAEVNDVTTNVGRDSLLGLDSFLRILANTWSRRFFFLSDHRFFSGTAVLRNCPSLSRASVAMQLLLNNVSWWRISRMRSLTAVTSTQKKSSVAWRSSVWMKYHSKLLNLKYSRSMQAIMIWRKQPTALVWNSRIEVTCCQMWSFRDALFSSFLQNFVSCLACAAPEAGR